MAFRINNNVNKHTKSVSKHSKSVEDKMDFYKLMWNDCDSYYIGQTGRPFNKSALKNIYLKKNLVKLVLISIYIVTCLLYTSRCV